MVFGVIRLLGMLVSVSCLVYVVVIAVSWGKYLYRAYNSNDGWSLPDALSIPFLIGVAVALVRVIAVDFMELIMM